MSDVLDYARAKDPRFKQVSDEDLTVYIGKKAPQFLDDDQFRDDFLRITMPGEHEAAKTAEAEAAQSERSDLSKLWTDVLTRPIAEFTKSASIGKQLQFLAGKRGITPTEEDYPTWRAVQLSALDKAAFPSGLTPGSFERHESFTDPNNPSYAQVDRKLKDYFDLFVKGHNQGSYGLPEGKLNEIFNGAMKGEPLSKPQPALGVGGAIGGAVSGIEDFVLGTVEFLSSPLGLLSGGMAKPISASAKAKAATALGFAALMGKHIPDQYKAFRDAISRGDTGEASRIGTEGLLNLAATGVAGITGVLEGIKGFKKAAPVEPGRATAVEPGELAPLTANELVETRPERLLPNAKIITPPPKGKASIADIERTLEELSISERQTVPEPTKRPAREAPPIIGEQPVGEREVSLLLPERFMANEAAREKLVAERDRLTNAFEVAAKAGDGPGMVEANKGLAAIADQLHENAREEGIVTRGGYEGEYPPTGEQLGTFTSRAIVPELSETQRTRGQVTPEDVPSTLPTVGEVNPPSTPLSRTAEGMPPTEYPQTVGVVPPEALAAEQPLPSGEFPPARPPKAGGVPESEQRSAQVTGQDVGRTTPKTYGGLFFLDPDYWVNTYGSAVKTAADAKQLYNTLRNKLGESSAAWKALDSEDFRKFMAAGQKRSPDEVRKWIEDHGPKVAVHSYGMEDETKVSEAGRVHADMVHSWYDLMDLPIRESIDHAVREATRNGRENNADFNSWVNQAVGDFKDAYPTAKVSEFHQKLDKFIDVSVKLLTEEEKPAGPVATSAYEQVSPKPTDQFPVERVDVVIPKKKPYTKESTAKDYEPDLWRPDNLHENLPNTLGWAAIQYDTLPSGEKVAHVFEAQSRWGQEQRRLEKKYENDKLKSTLPNHPLLSDYNRLILKAAIQRAREKGISKIVISDAETAMMTEGHDLASSREIPVEANSREAAKERVLQEYPNARISRVQLEPAVPDYNTRYIVTTHGIPPAQEPGMRLNYDQILPKIMEELTGQKGQKVDLGEHKNAMNPEWIPEGEVRNEQTGQVRPERLVQKPREDLIFKTPEGEPKTHVTGWLFDTSKAKESFSLFGKDKAIGIVKGGQLEAWADKVLAETPDYGKVRATFDPLDIRRQTAVAIKGAALMEAGVRDFASWSKRMIADHGKEIEPFLEHLYRRSANYYERLYHRQQQEGGEKPSDKENVQGLSSGEPQGQTAIQTQSEQARGGAETPPSGVLQTPQELTKGGEASGLQNQKEGQKGNEVLGKPEIVKTGNSKYKNPLGDPLGTLYRSSPDDWAEWNRLIKEPLDKPGVWPAREAIKNKYGGMPPEPPAPEALGDGPKIGIMPEGAKLTMDTIGNPSWWRRYFTSSKGLPEGVPTAWLNRMGDVKSEARGAVYEARNLANTLRKEYKISDAQYAIGGLSKVPKPVMEAIQDVLTGQRELTDLPESVREPVEKLRGHVDELSAEISGVFKEKAAAAKGAKKKALEELAATIDENLGIYLNRSYRIFDDPKWVEKIVPEVRRSAEHFIADQYASIAAKNAAMEKLGWQRLTQERTISPEFAQEFATAKSRIDPETFREQAATKIREMLADWTDAGLDKLLNEGKLGSKDNSIFMQRKDLAPEIRALMGEYGDPVTNYVRSITKMARWLGDQEFLTKVKELGLGKWLFEEGKSPPGFEHQIAAEGSDSMSPLNGLRTSKQVKDVFEQFNRNRPSDNLLAKMYFLANAWTKEAKTVYSVLTQARNATGNPVMNIKSGHFNFQDYGEAFKLQMADIAGSDKKAQAAYQDMVKYGLADENPIARELRDSIKDAGMTDPSFEDFTMKGWARVFNSAKGAAERAYRMPDEMGKWVAWQGEMADMRKYHPDWTEAQLKQEAATRVRNEYPTYSMTPEWMKEFRKQPLFGPFVNFAYESWRNMYWTLRNGASDLYSSNRSQQLHGAKKLAGAATVLASGAILSMIGRYLFMNGQKVDDDVRRFLPPWAKNAQIIPLGRDGTKIKYLNYSYVNPYSNVTDPFVAALNNDQKGILDKSIEAFAEMVRPFANEQMLFSALDDWRRNRDSNDRPIYNEQDTPEAKMGKVAERLLRSVEPGTEERLRRRIIPAAQGKLTASGQELNLPIEIFSELTGLRSDQIDLKRGLSFKVKEFQEQEDNSRKLATSVLFAANAPTTGEAVAAYKKADDARFRLWQELYKDVAAVTRLGAEPEEIHSILAAGRISKSDRNNLLNGQYVPLQIKAQDFRNLRKPVPSEIIGAMADERQNRINKPLASP